VARTPDIEIFACPACAKLYKRRVDIWIDMSGAWQPSSPPPNVPRVCLCGREFLLSEATVVAYLSPKDRKRPTQMTERGVDEYEIPEFLRKRDDNGGESGKGVGGAKSSRAPKQKSIFARWFERLLARFRKPPVDAKKELLQKVQWDMEAVALPERIASDADRP